MRFTIWVTSALLGSMACGGARDVEPPSQGAQVVAGTAPLPADGLPSVIMLMPQDSIADPVPTDVAIMDQFGIAFLPTLLLVRAGQPLEFRNSEEVPHNVHVVETATGSTLLNVATTMGEPYQHTFDRTGGYAVSCDLHPGMSAFVLVVSAPYATVAGDDGAFLLSDVPAGAYTLTVWSADPERRIERPVQITDGRTELTLATSR